MSVSKLSPSSNLLRGSRLFALPKPLTPALKNTSSQPVAHSDTATSPYPTHAAIETATDALHRGEWGLKRALPLKSTTKTGTPYIRIKDGIDTIEHITNFEPAADHVLTLKKFQTLNIPVLLPDDRGHQGPNPGGLFSSPFEDRFHSTSKSTSRNSRRWTSEGPWIAGQSNLEFEAFLKSQVRERKSDFRGFLRETLIAERTQQRLAQIALESSEGQDGEVQINDETRSSVANEIATKVSSDEAALDSYIKQLRAKPSKFTPLIQAFFDLPDTPQRGRDNSGQPLEWKIGNAEFRQSSIASPSYREMGMPTTHPSAGLGYLRLASYAANHPVYGPQSQADPIQARILKPGTKMVADNRRRAKLGAAGFVTDQYQEGYNTSDDKASAQLREFASQPGGNKYPVRPSKVYILPDGRPVMETMATRSDKVVMAGLKEEMPVEEYLQRRQPGIQSLGGQMPRLDGNYGGGAGGVASGSTSSGEAGAALGSSEAGAATVDGAMEQRTNREQRIGEALRRNRQGLSAMLNRKSEPQSQTQGRGQDQKVSSASSSEGDLLNDMIARLSR